jgi:hypothetical protein
MYFQIAIVRSFSNMQSTKYQVLVRIEQTKIELATRYSTETVVCLGPHCPNAAIQPVWHLSIPSQSRTT